MTIGRSKRNESEVACEERNPSPLRNAGARCEQTRAEKPKGCARIFENPGRGETWRLVEEASHISSMCERPSTSADRSLMERLAGELSHSALASRPACRDCPPVFAEGSRRSSTREQLRIVHRVHNVVGGMDRRGRRHAFLHFRGSGLARRLPLVPCFLSCASTEHDVADPDVDR